MSYRGESRKWRGIVKKLDRLAGFLEATANEIRYANKPADLVFPYVRILGLVKDVERLRHYWMEWVFGLRALDRGRWPHI